MIIVEELYEKIMQERVYLCIVNTLYELILIN